MKFEELEIEPKIIQVLNQLGYDEMLPIQEKVIPVMESIVLCNHELEVERPLRMAYPSLNRYRKMKENHRL